MAPAQHSLANRHEVCHRVVAIADELQVPIRKKVMSPASYVPLVSY